MNQHQPTTAVVVEKSFIDRHDLGAYVYLLPVLFVVGVFQLLPIVYSIIVSFYRWDLIGDPEYIGIDNYSRLFADPMFYKSLWNTLTYTVVSVPAGIFSALAVALLLNNKIAGLGFYRTIYFIPVITSINAVAIVWNFIYHPSYGLLNSVLDTVGVAPQKWLEDPNLAMFCIILMSVWKGLGYNVIIFLTGLQNIPAHLYEAARIDGANRWQQFRHITWPMLSPVTYFVFVMSVIGSFQVFSQVYMMTPRGGPMKCCMVIVYYVYQVAFEKFEFGYGLAMAFILFLMIFSVTMFNKLFVEKRVHYN